MAKSKRQQKKAVERIVIWFLISKFGLILITIYDKQLDYNSYRDYKKSQNQTFVTNNI